MEPNRYGGNSMVATLPRGVICTPENAGWGRSAGQWNALGYLHAPNRVVASQQHAVLRRELEAAGAEVIDLPADHGLSLDAVYTHDPSFMTDFGAICLAMGKPARRAEPACHEDFCRTLGVPVLGTIRLPGTVEAGDLVWLDQKTVLAGRGYRTNAAGIEQLRALLGPIGVEVISAPLPHSAGPSCCLHLMSLISLLD